LFIPSITTNYLLTPLEQDNVPGPVGVRRALVQSTVLYQKIYYFPQLRTRYGLLQLAKPPKKVSYD
jgi:hypothetical protein